MKLLKAAVAASLLITLAACGTEATSGDTDRSWSYTDGRGTVIKADHTPERIVAQSSVAGGLWDLGIKPVGTFGPLKAADGSTDPQAGSVDPAEVTDLTGAAYGEIDLEKLAALKPDLVVSHMFVPPELWYLSDAVATKAEQFVPTAGLDFKGASLVESIGLVEELAERLGADLGTAKHQADRAAFDAATDRIKAVGAELRAQHKTVLAVSATPDTYYVGDIDQFPDLALANDLGVPFIKAKATSGGYWEELSWERSDTYDADIILWDSRDGDALVKNLKAQPLFSTIKGARNNAYVPWQAVGAYSYKAYAKIFDDLADRLEKQAAS